MPNTENMRLHLCYRLWIADMNADLTVLRIFDDYIAELSSQKKDAATNKSLEEFQQKFIEQRKNIDELKHEMHLVKMMLAANPKEKKRENKMEVENHPDVEKRYNAFRKDFDELKKEFIKVADN